MHANKKALLAAGLLAGAAVMTGCAAMTTPVATPTPLTQKTTAEPATMQPAAQESPEANGETAMEIGGEEAPAPLTLRIGGKEVSAGAVMEEEKLLLPLTQTAEALGWKADSQQTEEDAQTKRVVTLDKDDSRITVSWTVSDNTTRGITWQKDGLLIPVDTHITTIDDVVYVPAAFFETAMDVRVSLQEDGVSVERQAPKETPETQAQELEGNG